MFILVAVLVLGTLIVVHEFGHFIVAKRLGVGILKFSVGFGPKLLGRKIEETEYVIGAIPLGGYVKMAGEDPDDEESAEIDPRKSFAAQSLPKRVAIVLAGPLFNILFAFVAVAVSLFVYGAQVPVESARVGSLVKGMPAVEAGIEEGDLILAVGDRSVSSWKELSEAIRASGGKELVLRIRRGEETVRLSLRAVEMPEKNVFGEVTGRTFLIGIGPGFERRRVGPVDAVIESAAYTLTVSETIAVGIVKLFQGKINRRDIGGPILIVQAAGEQARIGLENLVRFMAVISINLGILNLLPIPVLDGGHLLFFALEGIRRKPLNMRHKEIAQQVGLVILVALMAFAFYNDIARVIQGGG